MTDDHGRWLEAAIEEARAGAEEGGVPIVSTRNDAWPAGRTSRMYVRVIPGHAMSVSVNDAAAALSY